jgi:hypothetical protein
MSDRRARWLLRLVLETLGVWLALSSRVSGRFRGQVTRGVVIEVSSDDGVSRRFVFDGATRTVALLRYDRAARADCALRFGTAGLALRVLGSPNDPQLMRDGLADGTVRLEGNPTLFLWFQGLIRAAAPSRATRTPLPGVYKAPDRSAPRARFITVESPVSALDPAWTGAARAREQLAIWRVANGGRPPRG